ncbi:MAG: hypothetical protein M0P12_00725 [Paludibacteraceae bacterium]|nr:hypothetical protein [Paludibacteraceae bacterium]
MADTYTNVTTKQVYFPSPCNPEVVITNDLTIPSLGSFERKIFTRIQYAGEPFFILAPNTSDVFLIGQNGFFLQPLGNEYSSSSQMPTFMTKGSYENNFKKTASAFLTAQKSLMPKLLVPSQMLTDNGIAGGISTGVFAWEFKEEERSRCNVTTDDEQSSVAIKKGFGNSKTEARLTRETAYIPQSITDIDTTNVIGGGAFQMVISVFDTDIPSQTLREEGTSLNPEKEGKDIEASTEEKLQPNILIQMGDLILSIETDGRCVASWKQGEKNSETVNLVRGLGEECIPQGKSASTDKGESFVITIYPLWDGVVIQSGVQTGKNIISSSTAYLPVVKKASIFDFAEMRTRSDGTRVPFDPENPDEIFVMTRKGSVSVMPNLGTADTELIVSASNCSCCIAFSPIYFARKMSYVHTICGNMAVNGYSYSYKGFPIWTKNDTNYSTDNEILFTATTLKGPAEYTKVFKSNNIVLQQNTGKYQRRAGEIFGEIIQMTETVPASSQGSAVNYNNGISGWEDYITNVTINSTLDSNTGTLSWDKYGATNGNQSTAIAQSVGKININVKGGYNTNGALSRDDTTYSLFRGYTYESSESSSNSGCDVTVNLVGVEKRLDDVNLINPPIFDGWKFVDVAAYLCKFAGVAYDLSSADQSVRLQMSTDPFETVCFNWTTGLICRQALDEICKDTAHGYVIKDGLIKFFQRLSDGRPNYTGTIWTGFDGTNIQNIEMNPNFENLRNQIVLIGMRKITEDAQKDFPDKFPVFPMTALKKNITTPSIPWPKRLCYTVPGFPTQNELDNIANKIAKGSNYYEIMGSTTIPGANIKILDKFLGYIVIGVTHNIDLVGKTWTTSLQLQK